MDDTRLRLIGPSSGNVSGLHQPTLTLGARLAHVPVSLIVRLVPPARIRLLGRDCRTTKMRERDARAAIAANAAQIRLCVKTVIARLAQVPELAEAFAKQRSQKHETRQILSSWRRGRDSNPRYGYPYAAFRVRCFQPLSHLSKPLHIWTFRADGQDVKCRFATLCYPILLRRLFRAAWRSASTISAASSCMPSRTWL